MKRLSIWVSFIPIMFMILLYICESDNRTLWFLCGISFYWAKILIDYIGKKRN